MESNHYIVTESSFTENRTAFVHQPGWIQTMIETP